MMPLLLFGLLYLFPISPSSAVLSGDTVSPPLSPLHVLNLVHALQDILQRNTSMGMYWHSDRSAPAAVLQHFFGTQNIGDTFKQIENMRDPAKLCPLDAFVCALAKRLYAEFSQRNQSMQEWRAEVQASLQHLQTQFNDVALRQRGIDDGEVQCAEWRGSPADVIQLAESLRIDWDWDDETVPDFVLHAISVNLTQFLHEHASSFSISARVALVQHCVRQSSRSVLGRVPDTFNETFPYESFIEGLLGKNLDQLAEEMSNNCDLFHWKRGLSISTEFCENLITFMAKIAKIKVQIGSLNLFIPKSNYKDDENLNKNEKSWQEGFVKNEVPESVQLLMELFGFGREICKQLVQAQPLHEELRLKALKHWPLLAICEHFGHFVDGFEEHLQTAHLYIAPERMNVVLSRQDTCKSWLIWFHEQHGKSDQHYYSEEEVENLCKI